jgi:predicted outer membrane repeat protein
MFGARQRGHGSHRRRSNFRPQTEALDERCLLSTLTVLNTNDSGTGSLRAEITAASKGDTIVFDSSLDGQTINLTSGELVINKSLTVQGPGAGQLAISGGGLSRVFEVDAKETVSVSGLTLENGSADSGGAIGNAGGTLTVSGCTITGNNSTQGGAIYSWGQLTVSNSTLSGNSALAGYGGAIYNAGGTMTISNSTLSGNSALAGYGGAIYSYDGSLALSDSTFSDNRAGHGSAIYLDGWTKATVTGCSLSDSASGYGYLIWVNAGTLSVKSTYFHNLDGLYIYGPYKDGGGNTFA